jgi:hypothetical protein
MKRLLRMAGRIAIVPLATMVMPVVLAVPVYGDAATESQARLLNDVKFLASDDLQGRGVGTDGLNKAADFVRAEFAKAGLDVTRVEGDAFQKFSMTSGSELGTPNTLQFLGPDGAVVDLKYDVDFRTCAFGASKAFEGELVFCGYAIDDEQLHYRELERIDLKGKVAVIVRRVPQQDNPHGPFNSAHGGISRHGELRAKLRIAIDRGAAAILFVNDPYTVAKNAETDNKLVDKAKDAVVIVAEELTKTDPNDSNAVVKVRESLKRAIGELNSAREEAKKADNDPLMDLQYMARGNEYEVPVMQITIEACDRVLKAALKKTLPEIEKEIDTTLDPQSAVLTGWKAKGESSVKKVRTEVKNVVGVLEGEGPHADETIVIGAHYDHVGLGGEGSLMPGSKAVHNGADDNASGTVSLIELARQLALREKKLPRRLVFIAFTGEELGLIGSAHYCKEPLFPLDKTVAMFNMDMVGRLKDEKLTVFGSGTAPNFKGELEALARTHGFDLTLKPGGFGPSDQSSFYAKKIPVLHFFTGTHGDYHRPSDDWDKINVPGMNRIVDMISEIVVATAAAPDRPQYVEVKERESIDRGGSRPYFGSIPDFGAESPGYHISGVAPGSPADKAGLKGGDAIVQLGKHKVSSLEDFDLALRDFSAGDEVEVVVKRNGENVILKVMLAKPR